jgi:hypothetical protein
MFGMVTRGVAKQENSRKGEEDLSLVSILKLKKIRNEMDLLLGDKVPSQCEEAPKDYECDTMSTQPCCIIYNVMHGHQSYSFRRKVKHGIGFVDKRILIMAF